ncbi:MAG: RagB/SusD family nutrient uptake outer membrane protein [Flavobacteriaceae bacterium]|jgi:hypothetical protein|nr:RagB/SusD family nutrient uptake outer membrane protein [Flavobacteriaceae bacterium]
MKQLLKNIHIAKIVILISSVFLLSSCEDYLKDELLSDTSVDFLYGSPEGLESALVGLYTIPREIYQNRGENGSFPIILQAKSDLAAGITGEISLYSRLAWGAFVGDHGTEWGQSFYWIDNYKIVDRANAIIKGAENTQFDDEAQKNKILAEAKCMRANAFFTLYRLFNNIYVNTEPTTPENAFYRPEQPSTKAEIFTLLKSDLDFAIANLDWTTSDFGRWTQASARHLRAKVALWEDDWTEAAAQADAVITNGSYNLLANTKDVFSGNLDHSETLLAIQFERDVIGGGTYNFINWNLVPSYHSAPGMIRTVENGGSGAGFLVMNNYLIDLLKEDPNDDRDDRSYYISEYPYNNPETLPADKTLGEPLDQYDEFSGDRTEFTNYYRRQNPSCIKFLDETADPTDRNHYKNIMVFRLAETYLIGSEAHMRLGNDTKALEYLNAIRERAHCAPKATISQEIILEEHARELAFEGHRWYTLKRMGVLLSYLQDHMGSAVWNATYTVGDPRLRIEEHMKNWAIPQTQLELLGPNYPQNDGY